MRLILAGIVAGFCLAGCNSSVEVKTISLQECMERAVKTNLDSRLAEQNQKIEQELKTAETLGLLPELQEGVSPLEQDDIYGLVNYKELPDMQFQDLMDKKSLYGINQIHALTDFSLAFVNSSVIDEPVLLQKSLADRMAQNLSFEAACLYFQVTAIQKVMKNISGDEKYKQYWEKSCSEFRKLSGLKPDDVISVDDSILEQELPEFKFSDIPVLEQMAFLNRPEIIGALMISHKEYNKTLGMFAPSSRDLRTFHSIDENIDLLAYYTACSELNLRACYNLCKLPHYLNQPGKRDGKDHPIALARSLGIGCQVRMAFASYRIARRLYDSAENEVDKTLLNSNLHTAYYHLLHALGLSDSPGAFATAKERAVNELAKE